MLICYLYKRQINKTRSIVESALLRYITDVWVGKLEIIWDYCNNRIGRSEAARGVGVVRGEWPGG